MLLWILAVLLQTAVGEPDLGLRDGSPLLDDSVGEYRDAVAREGIQHSDLDTALTTAQLEQPLAECARVWTSELVPLFGQQVEQGQATVVCIHVLGSEAVEEGHDPMRPRSFGSDRLSGPSAEYITCDMFSQAGSADDLG